MEPLAWPALLLLLGLLLLLLEVFIPSGGILGFLSVSAMAVSIVLAFYHNGATTGFSFLALAAIAVPTVLVLAFRWWPETPMGRRVLPPIWTSEDVLPDSPQRRSLKELVGKIGRAKTVMLPSGAVTVDGRTVDAVSEGTPIEPGQPVQVIQVRGTWVVVRPVDEEPPPPNPDDILSRPIDSLGLDAFDDPLA